MPNSLANASRGPSGARRNADDLGGVRSEAPQGGSVQPRDESGANHANTNDHEFYLLSQVVIHDGKSVPYWPHPPAPSPHVERGSLSPRWSDSGPPMVPPLRRGTVHSLPW